MNFLEKDEDGLTFVRESLVVAFFYHCSYHRISHGIEQIFSRWIEMTPPAARQWALVGPHAEEYKPLSARLLSRAQAELTRAAGKGGGIRMLCVGGPEEINADYHFAFQGFDNPLENEACVIEFRFPVDLIDCDEFSNCVNFALWVASVLPYDSGYISRALVWGVDSQQMEFADAVQKWIFRHPGLDIADNLSSSMRIGSRVRGPYWMTFVGPTSSALIRDVEMDAILKENGIELQHIGDGLVFRVGPKPLRGDTNKGENLPEIRALAQLLFPITLLGDTMLDNCFIEPTERARWERRFID